MIWLLLVVRSSLILLVIYSMEYYFYCVFKITSTDVPVEPNCGQPGTHYRLRVTWYSTLYTSHSYKVNLCVTTTTNLGSGYVSNNLYP